MTLLVTSSADGLKVKKITQGSSRRKEIQEGAKGRHGGSELSTMFGMRRLLESRRDSLTQPRVAESARLPWVNPPKRLSTPTGLCRSGGNFAFPTVHWQALIYFGFRKGGKAHAVDLRRPVCKVCACSEDSVIG